MASWLLTATDTTNIADLQQKIEKASGKIDALINQGGE